jgi:hypothetical protein
MSIIFRECNNIIILLTLPDEKEELKLLLIEFKKVSLEKILNCPLNTLYNDDFVNKLKLYVDHLISLKTLRDVEEKGYPFEKSPNTRKKIIDAINFGVSEEHVKYIDYNLMNLLTIYYLINNFFLTIILHMVSNINSIFLSKNFNQKQKIKKRYR